MPVHNAHLNTSRLPATHAGYACALALLIFLFGSKALQNAVAEGETRTISMHVPLEELRVIGLRLQRGGVGFYPTSGTPFVHMDTGGVRMWPRMTREQLLHVFPDGRTAYILSNGRPLAGYAQALADIEKRGQDPQLTWLEEARQSGTAMTETAAPRGAAPKAQTQPIDPLLAALEHQAARMQAARLRSAAAEAASTTLDPARIYDVALLPPPSPASSRANESESRPASSTANQIIVPRGYWDRLFDDAALAPKAAETLAFLPRGAADHPQLAQRAKGGGGG
ncbi:MAG: DUF882 domain-containing protein, partial [Pseudomonadota bacterium]